MANNEARSTAYVSFDGRNQQELRDGDRSVLLFRKERRNRLPPFCRLIALHARDLFL